MITGKHQRSSPHLLSGAVVAALCGLACAQPSKPTAPPTKQAPAPSTAPAANAPPPVLTRHPINKRDWTLHCEVRLHGFQYRAMQNKDLTPTSRMKFNRALFYFPLLPGSSMHDVYRDKCKGYVRAENISLDDSPRFAEGYQAGAQLMVFDIGEVDTVRMTMHTETVMTCYETTIDEARARKIPWPKEPWDPTIASALQPQLFVEVEDAAVQALVKQWTGGNPRGMMPYDLAKLLAGKVVEYYAPTEGIYETAARGLRRGDTSAVLFTGYNVDGAAAAARAKRGSPHDMANLLTAIYRAAGLPARVVIGYDVKGTQDSANQDLALIRAWTEFYLLDEANKRGEWIPVDVLSQREFSSRPPPLTQSWEYFGNNLKFDFVCPIAFHWMPPTISTNQGPPALWGFVPDPVFYGADQEIRFYAFETPKRGDDPEIRNRNKKP